jgi:hypothetical protein
MPAWSMATISIIGNLSSRNFFSLYGRMRPFTYWINAAHSVAAWMPTGHIYRDSFTACDTIKIQLII